MLERQWSRKKGDVETVREFTYVGDKVVVVVSSPHQSPRCGV